ncbi:MAG TPA: isoprenylcysteine carboxylmethyltransferase family protein [Anseongella sp.]
MEPKNDHPGVYMPPPVLYITTFLAALLLQRMLPLRSIFFGTCVSTIIGWLALITGLVFAFPALRQFFITKNTLVTIKPAHALQTSGIYSISRNPMYVGLLFLYSGLSLLAGNWWNFILLPLLVLLVQEYVIKREEKYLGRRFGKTYFDYRSRVRRWL